MPRCRRTILVTLVLTVAALAGCSDAREDARGSTAPPSDSRTPSASPSPSRTAPPWSVMAGPLARCGPQPDAVARTAFQYGVLRDPDVGEIPMVRVGHGDTVVVLLHQTDGNGLCGWLPFGRDLARASGITALAVDLCRYGESTCEKVEEGRFGSDDQTDAVALAVRHAHDRLHARRVVVVGASMGGSLAVISGSTLTGIDAVVDLSGPVEWPGMDVVEQGRRLAVPLLAATADDEGPEEVRGLRTIVANAPPGSALLRVEHGHGYELLHDVEGRPAELHARVIEWIRSR